jgi:sodium transport system permease protein
MNPRKTAVVYRKELLETLRDRRFLISSILVPLLMFPVMILGIGGLIGFMAFKESRRSQNVMIRGAESAPQLMRKIEKIENIELVAAADDYVQRVNDKKLQAVVEIPPQLEARLAGNPDEPFTIKIFHFEGELRSRSALRAVTRAIDEYGKELVAARLTAKGISTEILRPFKSGRQNVASTERVSGNILGMMLPYIIILLTLTGAMYPAMDLTAGEKERGTMETILASPAGRIDIVVGKFLLVLTVSLLTTVLSILSMAGTVLIGASWLNQVGAKLVLVISGKAMTAVFLLVLPLAVFFAAALLAISLYARNYKEAQSYIGPMMFLVIFPAMGSFIPGVELNAGMALIPVLNISLLARELFAGQYPWNLIAVIFFSTSLYAAAAIYFAVRQFQREEVIFRA